MATIRKRTWKNENGKPAFRYQLSYVDKSGERHRKQFAKKSDADAERIRIENEMAEGKHVPDTATKTLREGWDEWLRYLENLQRLGKRERVTVRHYRTHFEKHIEPTSLSGMAMNKLNSANVQVFLEELESKTSHALSVKIYGTLRMLLGYCRRRRWLAHNPCEGIKLQRPRRYDKEPLKIPPKEDIRVLLAKATEHDITGKSAAILRLMVFRGLRISEIRGLPIKGLKLDGPAPHVEIMQRADDYRKIGRPKSHTSYRTLALSPEDVLAMRKWLLASGAKDEVDPERLVFGTATGRAYSYQNLFYRWWMPLMKEAGLASLVFDPKTRKVIIDPKTNKQKVIPNFTPHQLRHAFASLHIERGIQPKRLQVMMGHSSIKITMDTYGHLWKDDAADQALAIAVEAQLG